MLSRTPSIAATRSLLDDDVNTYNKNEIGKLRIKNKIAKSRGSAAQSELEEGSSERRPPRRSSPSSPSPSPSPDSISRRRGIINNNGEKPRRSSSPPPPPDSISGRGSINNNSKKPPRQTSTFTILTAVPDNVVFSWFLDVLFDDPEALEKAISRDVFAKEELIKMARRLQTY